MKIGAAEGDRFLRRLPEKVLAVLIYGPDQGLVTERAECVIRTVVPDIRDPFRISEIDGSQLLEDRARLAAEAAALSFSGGRRVVRVRQAGNSATPIFDDFLEKTVGDALVVVEAGELAKSSSLRKLFEEAPNAAAVPCYPDSADNLAELLRGALDETGIDISPEAIMEAVPLLGSDRGTNRRQIEKLILYAGDKRFLDVADIRAIIGDEGEARAEEVCDAAGEGNPKILDRALERLWAAGLSPIGVLRIALGHFQRVLLVKSAMAAGESFDSATRRLKPQLHFARTASFRNQLGQWDVEKLGHALDLLLDTEALCKSTAVPPEAVCGQALFNLAALARLRR